MVIYWDLYRYRYLVGADWNMTFIFPYIGNFIIPMDELIFFRGIETTNQQIHFIIAMAMDGRTGDFQGV